MAITCSRCGTSVDKSRMPRSWRRVGTEQLCPKCKENDYCPPRAYAFPVDDVLDGGDWSEFTALLRDGWSRARSLANWAVKQLVLGDVTRTAGMEKLPPAPSENRETGVYLYGRMVESYPDVGLWSGSMSSAQCLLRWTRQQYNARRYDTIWTGLARFLSFRWPVPFPVHNQNWKAEWVEDEHGLSPVVELPLLGRRWRLKLRGRHGSFTMRRQVEAFGHIVSGAAVRGELSLYRQRASSGCHRRTTEDRNPGGGNRVRYRIMCKLVAMLPREEDRRQRRGTLTVRTGGPRTLLVASMPGDERPWVLRNNQVRGWIMRHDKFLQEIADDLKAERRPRHERLGQQERIEKACELHHRRMRTFVQTAAAHVAGLAERRGAAALEYDDSDRRYFKDRDNRSGFPWSNLRKQLSDRVKYAGMVFRLGGNADASGAAVE